MKKLINKLSVFVLALTLSLGAVFSTACKMKDDGPSSSAGGTEEPAKPTNTKREETYTFDALGNAYGDETVADLMFKNGVKAPLKDYMLGDAFNEILKILSSSMATMKTDSTPSVGIDISKWFGYDYYTDGHWYSRTDGKQVHEVLDLLLSYELDGSNPVDVDADVIAEYADDALITVMPSMKMLVQMDETGTLERIFNIKIGEVAGLLSGDKSQIEKSIKSILGELTVKEISPSLGITINESSPKMLKAAGELKLSYLYSLSSMDEAQLVAEAKKFLSPFTVEDLLNVYGIKVDETSPKMLKGIAALTFTEIFDAFDGEDGGAAFVSTFLDTYTVEDALGLCGVKIDETSPVIVRDFADKKLSEIFGLLLSDDAAKTSYVVELAQKYSLADVSELFGKTIDENSPVMLKDLKDKKVAELLVLSSKTDDEAKTALIALYGKYTVKDFYEAMGQTAPDGSESITLDTVIEDFFKLTRFDGAVDVIEKYAGDVKVGTIYAKFGLPVKSDFAETTFGTLSQQAKSAANETCPAEKPEDMTDEEYLALKNEQYGVYFTTLAKLVVSALDTDALKIAVGAEIDAMLEKFGITELLPGITVDEVIASLGDATATKSLAMKVLSVIGVDMTDEEFEAAYETYVAPVTAQINKSFNENVFVGKYTVCSFVKALTDNATREEAIKTLKNEIDAADGDFTATPAFANLVNSSKELGDTVLGSLSGAVIEYSPEIKIAFGLGGVDYEFTLESVIEFAIIFANGGDEALLAENDFYKAISRIKVKDLFDKAEEIIKKIIESIPSEPSEPDVPEQPEKPSDPEKPSGDKNGVDLPIIEL